MIECPIIWLVFPVALLATILISWWLAASGKLENSLLRKGFVVLGAALGFLVLALPFFQQPRFHHPLVNYGLGIPLVGVGLVGRVYPMIYLRRRGTTTALEKVARVVDTGPYGVVRHPQYTSGMILIAGWFVVWGAVYCLCMMPLVIGLVAVQAMIEERYILEKEFGEAYREYKERVGMLLPRVRRKREG